MSTLRPRSTFGRGAATALVAGVLPLALTACGASRDAQTYQERSQADATNTAVGTLAVRGLSILPPEEGRTLAEGSDAEAVLVVTNNDSEPDVLESITTDAAESVEVLVDAEPASLRVPPLGSTGNSVRLRLVSLTRDLREGEYATLVFRFQKNGTLEVPVPVAVSGRTDRPVYTGEEGGEEPALQAPAGGEETGAEGEPGQGDISEGEFGQVEGDDDAPREDEAEAPSGGASEEPSVAPSAEGSGEGTDEGTEDGADAPSPEPSAS